MKLRAIAIVLFTLFVVSCGNQRREPVVPDPTPLQPITEQRVLHRLWSIAAGKDALENRLHSLLPAVMNDVVYTASPGGTIRASEVDDGTLIWQLQLRRPISSGVGANENMLAVVTDSGTLIAIGAENGTVKWEVETGRAVLSPPLVHVDDFFVRTIDGALLAFSGEDGAEFWKAEFDQPNFLVSGEPQPVAAGAYIILGNAGNQLYGFDAAAGFIGWQFRIGERRLGSIASSQVDRVNLVPMVYNNIVYIAVPPNSLVAYDVLTGQDLWTVSIATASQLAIDLSAVYGFDDEGRVFAVDRVNGEMIWSQTDLLYRGITDIAVVKGSVVVSDRQGFLHVLNSANGDFIGRFESREVTVPGGLQVQNSTLFATYASGKLDVFVVRMK